MGKIRIYELAKELHQDSKTIINELNKMNQNVSNHMSTVDDDVAGKIRATFSKQKKAPEKKQAESAPAPAKKVDEKKRDKQEKRPPAREHSEKKKPQQPARDKKEQPRKEQPAAAAAPKQGKQQNKKDNRNSAKNKNHAQNQHDDYPVSGKKNHNDRNNRNHQNRHQKNRNKKNKKNAALQQKETHDFAEVQHHVVIEQTITVQDLAKQLGKKASEVIMKLMSMGMMATMNQELDFETAEIITEEYGATIELKATMEENLLSANEEEDRPEDLVKRPPVVTIM
ncbi:MAG: translation initiation factor IF-2 N-terminal domain-containing protein [Peptococcaceae bacterium]|nr:translation initiation factor IF-2 N-terminal domain-containing protein [Peptococcaceae bacterium]